MINDRLIIRALPRAHSIAHDIVDGELDEFCALVEPTLRFRPNVAQAPLDILDFEETQLILIIKMRPDHLLELTPDAIALRLVRAPVHALERAGHCLEAKHLRDEPGAYAVAPREALDHVELHGELRDFSPV